jgi:hypothetical protein
MLHHPRAAYRLPLWQGFRFAIRQNPAAGTMNPIEIVGEIFTVDSAFIRGWRWLFSPSYRQLVRARRKEHRPLLFAAGVFETVILMVAEILAVVFLVQWVVTL